MVSYMYFALAALVCAPCCMTPAAFLSSLAVAHARSHFEAQSISAHAAQGSKEEGMARPVPTTQERKTTHGREEDGHQEG